MYVLHRGDRAEPAAVIDREGRKDGSFGLL